MISAESREEALARLYRQVAADYYALTRAVVEHDRSSHKKSERIAISKRRALLPRTATGLIVDRMNVVVPDATVMISKESAENVIGRGRTDRQGRFEVDLYTAVYRDITLHVMAEGYSKWMRGGIYGGIQEYRIRLDRHVDKVFLDTLVVEQEPRNRLWMVLEIIGARSNPVEIKTVFPRIGLIRGELLRVMTVRRFYEKDDPVASPADRALELLAFWHDPADVAMILERLPKRGYTLFKKTVISGPSPGHVCRVWADAHFAQAELDPRPPSSCSKPHYGPDRRHALIEFSVFEHYGTYSQLLSMRDRGGGWELVLVRDNR
jgi:hypothetical protein